ncbi:MAG: hypothetical protein WCZ66_09290 [Sphingomonadaceae bacterium]
MYFMTLSFNVLFTLTIVGFVIWRLGWHFETHNCLERVSLSFVGAGMFFSMLSDAFGAHAFDAWGLNMGRGAFVVYLYAIFGTRRWRPVDQGKGCLQLLREARL